MARQGGPRLEVLGRVTIDRTGDDPIPVARPQVAAVLAMLWDERRPVRRDELAELLWGDWNFPDHWAGAVRGVVAKARRVLDEAGFAPDVLRANAGMVVLDLPDDATTDLTAAEELVTRATRALEHDDPSHAQDLAQRAVTILAQPPAVTAEGEWSRRLHLRIDTFGRQAHRVVAEALLAQGRSIEAVTAAEAAVDHDPLDEVAYEQLIRAYLAANRPAAARRVRDALVKILTVEYGVEPSTHLADLIDGPGPTAAGRAIESRVDGTHRFLGRHHELVTAQDRFDETVVTEGPGLVLVTGPAGIGKTRLVEEFLGRADARGLWGRCHADAGEPFEPFADAFRRLAGSDVAHDALSDPVVQRAVDALESDSGATVATGAREARGRVMHDVVAALGVLAASGPLVFVVDDLHWASGDTLGLLRRVLEETDLPILVVATARNEIAEPASLSELFRPAPSTVMALDVISAAELRPLSDDLVDLVDEPIDPDLLITQLWERTGGLPYYIDEVLRDAQRRSSLTVMAIPDQVHSWVRNRVEALPEDLVTLAEVAAVIGTRPSVAEIEANWVGPSENVLDGLERLIRVGLLNETDRPDQVAFAHQITREVIVDRISAPRLARLHARLAERLLQDPRETIPHARIVHHLLASGPEHRDEAARHGYLAGVASLARGAWDLADEQFGAALGCLDDTAVELRAVILVAQGWTRHARGHAGEATGLLDEATRVATELRLPHEVARAALMVTGRGGRGAAFGLSDTERIDRLRSALEAVEHWEPPAVQYDTATFPRDGAALAMLRTAVEVELAWAMLFTGSLAERTELLAGTLQQARDEDGGPHRLARALLAQRNVLGGAGRSDTRLAVVDEVFALPHHQLPDEIVAYAQLQRHEELLLRADRDGARAALDAAHVAIARHVHPYWAWAAATWESLWLLVNGDPDAAEAALAEVATIRSDPSPEAAACGAVQLVAIRLAQGRADEVVDLLAGAAAAQPEIPCYGAVLALARSLAGDLSGAEHVYRGFAAHDFAAIPVDSNRLLAVAALGDVAATLGDVTGARVLDGLLAPDDGLFVVHNCYGGGGAWWGPVARIRARLAAVAGRAREAEVACARADELVAGFGAATLGQPHLGRPHLGQR